MELDKSYSTAYSTTSSELLGADRVFAFYLVLFRSILRFSAF